MAYSTHLGVAYSTHLGFDALLQLMGTIRDAKAHDYSADSSSLGNFNLSATVVGLAPSTTVLVRMCDKLARVGSLVKKGRAEVKDESIRDTLLDLANYSLLMILLLEKETKHT